MSLSPPPGPPFRLDGYRVVVAGGSRGIGRAMALGFAHAGAAVSVCARGAAALAELGAAIRAEGGTVHTQSCDLADAPAGPAVALWLQVRDVKKTHRELLAADVAVTREPQREPWGLEEMWIEDPDGIKIAVIEVPEDHPLRGRR